MTQMVEKSLSARSVFILPVILLLFIHVFVTPLKEIFSIEPMLMIPYYLTGILISIFIHRRTAVVKDYEYRRSKVMKKMKSIYSAEESGVWRTNAEVSSEISNQSNLALNVSDISTEAPELEISNDKKVAIDLLSESAKIVETSNRISGKSNFEEQEVKSTIGATRNLSPMDKLLDFIGRLLGKKSSNDMREKQRQSALRAASIAAPVKAEKPNAPIQYERANVSIEQDSVELGHQQSSQINQNPAQELTDYSQTSDNRKNYPTLATETMGNNHSQSIEAMAMMAPSNMLKYGNQSPASSCRACGYLIKKEQRFCENCGAEIN